MKKIINLFSFLFLIMFIGIVNVKAINMVASSTEITAGNKITINFSDAYITPTPEIPNYVFSYTNKSNIEKDGNQVGFVGGDKLYFTSETGSITFKTKDVKNNYVIVFSIKDLNSGEEKTVSVNVKTKQTATTTTVPPTTTTTTQAAKSNNANLKTLEITGSDDSNVVLSPNFSSGVYDYSATVDASVKTITINATMEDPKSNMVISNNATNELKAGENNKITITVTAEDGTKKAYVINIMREALTADATLKSLIIKESKSFELKEDKFSYDVKIDDSVTKLTIDYVTSDENSTVSISGNEDLKDGSKVKILVTAEDGTKKEYVLTIVKSTKETKKATPNIAAEKSPLIIMSLSMIAFGLIGGIVYVIKK